MNQIYVTRRIPQDENGKGDFSQIDEGLKIGLLPYLEIIRINRNYSKQFIKQLTEYLKERRIDEFIVNITSRLPRNLKEAVEEIELIYKLNNALKRQIVRDISFSYGSVINHTEAYDRLKQICSSEIPPLPLVNNPNRSDYRSKLFEIISVEEYLRFIEEAKKRTIELNKRTRELGFRIGPENMPSIDYAEIALGHSREQEEFEKRLKIGSHYFAELNNPGWIGCNPFGDLNYLIENGMFLTLDTEHLNFSLIASNFKESSQNDFDGKNPFLTEGYQSKNIGELIQAIPQEIKIVHIGGGFNLFHEDIVDNRRVYQIASHSPFLFPRDFHKLSKEAQMVYLEFISPYFMERTETLRKNFMEECINALKQRRDNPKLVIEFVVGKINKDGIRDFQIYSGNLWREIHELSKRNLESLLFTN